jgi:hypothetical protein
VDANTIFRLASMTKIMGAAVAAIAFEEGVVQPGDSISKWIPEFDASHLTALTRHDADATHAMEWWSIEPLERNITVWDLLGYAIRDLLYCLQQISLGLEEAWAAAKSAWLLLVCASICALFLLFSCRLFGVVYLCVVQSVIRFGIDLYRLCCVVLDPEQIDSPPPPQPLNLVGLNPTYVC